MIGVSGRRVLICGDTELLGRHIYRALRKFGPEAVWCMPSGEVDDGSRAALADLFRESRAEIVIHICQQPSGFARQQGQRRPAAHPAADLLSATQEAGIEKVVVVGSALAYPPGAALPSAEADFAVAGGGPIACEATGFHRGFLLDALRARQRDGFPVVTLLTGELYGPGEDPRRQTGPFVDALLRKVLEARESDRSELRLPWSGTQSRDFTFVRDAAAGIALATARYECPAPLNLGTGVETTLGSVVEMISSGLGY